MKKNISRILSLLLLASITGGLVYGFNSSLSVENYTYINAKLPQSFDGYKIVQLSDLHGKEFGANNQTLIKTIKNQSPDLIVFTGDLIDNEHSSLDSLEALLKGISPLCPIYFVSGNHEYDDRAPLQELLALLENYSIINLDEKGSTITIEDFSITIQGMGGSSTILNSSHLLPPADTNKFNILLYHYTNHADLLTKFNYDLVLSGHTHGGIVRLPSVGGVFGNDGSLFPTYDSGIFQLNERTTMISSRGLGDAFLPRFNNPPEIVCITLKSN